MAIKGILWSILFFLTTIILIVIPTQLILVFWNFLYTLTDINGNPLYTYSMLGIFLLITSIIISLIYIAAGCRAITQRNSEDLGIPDGVKRFAIFILILTISFFIIWYLLVQEIAIFTWTPL